MKYFIPEIVAFIVPLVDFSLQTADKFSLKIIYKVVDINSKNLESFSDYVGYF
jgi:hypothetical protein